MQQCTVTGIETYTDDFGVKRLRSVQTDKGNIESDTVVNCAGLYALSVSRFMFSVSMFIDLLLLLERSYNINVY